MIPNQLEKFLDRLYRYRDVFVEIRPLPGKQAFFHPDDIDAIETLISHQREGNVYQGVGTRDGQGGTAKNVLHIPCVWCDVDFKTASREVLFDRLCSFFCKPTMIVQSGGGVHLYFCIKDPATSEDFSTVVDVNQRLAGALGGDSNATDIARILRPPPTYNFKYAPPRPVELKICDSFEYDLEFFLDELAPLETPAGADADAEKANPGGWLLDALKGVSAGSRDTTGAKIAGYFVNKLSDDDIMVILSAWNCHNSPPLPDSDIQKIVKSIRRYKRITTYGTPKQRIVIHPG